MGYFNEFPHTRTYDNDLGWLIKIVKELQVNLENFIKLNTVKYADPIQWNISTQYEANTVVIDALTGVAYISTQPVPSGVNINNTDYWTPVFTLDLVNLNKNITLRNDGDNHNATFTSVIGDWLIVGGQLYRVIHNISLHTAYVVGYNIEIYTVELFIKDYVNSILTMIGDLADLTTTDASSIVNAINELVTALNNIVTNIGNLTDLDTLDQTSLVNAINEIVGNIGDLTDLDTSDQTSLVNAINEVYGMVGSSLNALIPDNFTGTDGEKIQAAFDALENTAGTIIIDRKYTLDRNILIKHRTTAPNFKVITVIGFGRNSEIDFNDYCIQGYDTNHRDYGGLHFIALNMRGDETAFKTDYLIRLHFDSCAFWDFKFGFWGYENVSMQSIYIVNSVFNRLINNVVYSRKDAYDVHFDACRIELCDNPFYIGGAKVFTITNCVIEGKGITPAQGNIAIKIVSTYEMLVLTGNYFEANETTLDMSTCTNHYQDHAVIQGNGFWEQNDNIKSIILPESCSHAQILLDHNMFNLYGSSSYGIAVYNTGHDLSGVQINACNGTNFTLYDPDRQLHDVANYSEDGFTANVTFTQSTVSPLNFKRYGKVCNLNGMITLGENVSSGSPIITLDNRYNAPKIRLFFTICKMNGSAIASTHRGNIGTDGSVYCQEALSNGDLIAFDATWNAH